MKLSATAWERSCLVSTVRRLDQSFCRCFSQLCSLKLASSLFRFGRTMDQGRTGTAPGPGPGSEQVAQRLPHEAAPQQRTAVLRHLQGSHVARATW